MQRSKLAYSITSSGRAGAGCAAGLVRADGRARTIAQQATEGSPAPQDQKLAPLSLTLWSERQKIS